MLPSLLPSQMGVLNVQFQVLHGDGHFKCEQKLALFEQNINHPLMLAASC